MRKQPLTLMATLAVCLCAAPALAVVDFNWDTPVRVQIGGEFAYLEFHGILTNTGDERDSYVIHKDELIPSDGFWSASICVGEFCYAPFINDVTTESVDPGDFVDIRIDIVIGMEVGTGYGTLRVSSEANTGLNDERGYAAIHSACDPLVVDDSEDPFLSFSHFDAVAAQLSGGGVGHWPRALQVPSLADLQIFPTVFWLTGESQSTLDDADRAVLGEFLTGGGSLLVSGDDIAFDLCDSSSPNYSAATAQWVDSFFDISYEADYGDLQVDGLAGTDVGDGLSFSLDDPAADPDVIRLSRAGAAQFAYGTGGTAGVLSLGGKRLVYLGFDLADVAAASLAPLLEKTLVALAHPSASAPLAPTARLTLLPNQPNPFNPKTTLRFRAPAAGLAQVEILDLRGRVVAAFAATVAAGENALPFTARDAAGRSLASGTYFTRVALNGEVASGKMTLLK